VLIVSDVNVERLYSNWLLGLFEFIRSIARIMIVNYFSILRQALDWTALFKDKSLSPVWNLNDFVAFLFPVAMTFIAVNTGALSQFYSYGWFTGLILGGLIYYAMNMKAKI
jgi:NCS1 family nucleobase:cation symporter-1